MQEGVNGVTERNGAHPGQPKGIMMSHDTYNMSWTQCLQFNATQCMPSNAIHRNAMQDGHGVTCSHHGMQDNAPLNANDSVSLCV